jgi:hypothetical protein
MRSCKLRPRRSTDQAITMSNRRWVAFRQSASKAGRLSRPFAPLIPWSLYTLTISQPIRDATSRSSRS